MVPVTGVVRTLVLLGVLTACAATAPDQGAPTVPAAFPVGAAVDYQLGGAYAPPDGVGIVVRDSTAAPAAGVWSVCYVNGFQTQPGEDQRWPDDLVVRDAAGRPVTDPGWPDEMILDTTTPERRGRIAAILTPDIDRCARAGFAAVELDNLDTFTRIAGLTRDGNVALAAEYARLVHERGLLVGQKNAAEYTADLHSDVGFDFAVAEECVAQRECAAYTGVYGPAVIAVEYPGAAGDEPDDVLATVCADPTHPVSLVLRDRELVSAGVPGHVFGHC